ncbi:MAG: glycosyltransferase family 87 protein [Acidocella sp.]|nr:glycosyltransferase family 87 protein [Acidocella sp.]
MPQTRTTNQTSGPGSLLPAIIILVCAALDVAILIIMLADKSRLNSDFMAFWSYPRFAASHPVALLYNTDALRGFQQTLYPGFDSFYPYLYPPTLLLVTWWLKYLSFTYAQWLWSLTGLIAIIAAIIALFPTRRGPVMLAILASPACLLNLATGETACFTTALLLAGLAWLPRRPALAGIAFGLLTLKPQLGLLLPVLLLARHEWRAIITATLTAIGLVALSCIIFPVGLWPLWAISLAGYQADIFAGHGLNLHILVTPAANLISLGAPPALAWAGQLAATLTVAALMWLVARRGPYRLAAAALLTGGFLAVPHAYAYDTITITAALALCYRPTMPLWHVAFGGLVYLAPLLLLTPAAPVFLYAVPVAGCFALIIMLALAPPNGALSADEPIAKRASQC